MAGSRRGPRYGQTKNGAVDIDPTSPDRLIGSHLRELRIQAGMRLKDLAEAMRDAGFERWTQDVASAVQTGRTHSLRTEELPAVARLFGITADQFLRDALGEVSGTIDVGRLRPADLLVLARMLGTTVDKLLADSLDAPAILTAREKPRLDEKPAKWTIDMPPFYGYEGQPEELNKIAKELGVSRNALCREVLQSYIERYNKQH
jgi:transcriptional regulator with XRE-family HTH domain